MYELEGRERSGETGESVKRCFTLKKTPLKWVQCMEVVMSSQNLKEYFLFEISIDQWYSRNKQPSSDFIPHPDAWSYVLRCMHSS